MLLGGLTASQRRGLADRLDHPRAAAATAHTEEEHYEVL
jgi:hypothetical protein